MIATRPTIRERNDERRRQKRAEMETAIAENRLTVRQMTAAERREADVRRAVFAEAREARAARRRS
jgi:hypothetical protein